MPSDFYTKLSSSADELLHVGSFLNQADFARTKQALGHLLYPKGLFHNTHAFHKVSAAGQLLKATEYADYCQVEDLIADENKLNLMFKDVNFTFRDGSEERISPLRYAFRVLDTYMWKTVFLKRIEDIEDPEKRAEGLKKFFAQMKEQEKAGHINLEPLFEAYETYEEQCHRWFADEISDQAHHRAWHKLGKKQKALLPAHMLREFSCEGDQWRPDASFEVDRMLQPLYCFIDDRISGTQRSLSSILSDSGWGTSFSLARGSDRFVVAAVSGGLKFTLQVMSIDLQTFQRLFEVRSMQLSSMRQNEAQQAQRMAGFKPSNPAA